MCLTEFTPSGRLQLILEKKNLHFRWQQQWRISVSVKEQTVQNTWHKEKQQQNMTKKSQILACKLTVKCLRSPETILQLMVIGWKDFPGDSAGLGGWPCGTILQLAVIGWKAELPWEPRVILSLVLERVGVRSPAAALLLWPSADLPVSDLIKPGKVGFHLLVLCIDCVDDGKKSNSHRWVSTKWEQFLTV